MCPSSGSPHPHKISPEQEPHTHPAVRPRGCVVEATSGVCTRRQQGCPCQAASGPHDSAPSSPSTERNQPGSLLVATNANTGGRPARHAPQSSRIRKGWHRLTQGGRGPHHYSPASAHTRETEDPTATLRRWLTRGKPRTPRLLCTSMVVLFPSTPSIPAETPPPFFCLGRCPPSLPLALGMT